MAFDEVCLPARLAFGSTGGVERRTEIVTLASGFERRSTPWAQGRRRYLIGSNLKSLDDMSALTAFFEARRGRLNGFRFRDFADFKSCAPGSAVSALDQVLGLGDGEASEFSLVKTYGDQARSIRKPVAGSVRVAVGGEVLADGAFVVDATTGRVTLETAPDEAGGDTEALSVRATVLAPARIGRLAEDVAAGVVGRWDEVNAILIDVEGAAPSSLGGGAVLAGANGVAIQTAAGWEVVQFRQADLVGGGRWRLTGLLRAQQGTEGEMAAGGKAGGVVVFLDENLVRAEVAPNEYGLPMIWSAGPQGGPAGGASVTRYEQALAGVHRRPFSPAHLKLSVEAGGRRIRWIARTRMGGDIWEGEPSASDLMRFRVRVRDGEVVRREFEVEETQAIYAEADAASDFPGGFGSRAWVDVAQGDGRMGWGACATKRLVT